MTNLTGTVINLTTTVIRKIMMVIRMITTVIKNDSNAGIHPRVNQHECYGRIDKKQLAHVQFRYGFI